MEIEHCNFPDNLLYDSENNTWVNLSNTGEVLVGITSLLASLAGRLVQFRPKPVGSTITKGRSLGTLESGKFVGPVPSPLTGVILETNERVVQNPKILNDSPYLEGWIARLKPGRLDSEAPILSSVLDAEKAFKQGIATHHVRCFKLFPDQELYEIGVECSAVLVKLNEALSLLPVGGVVHIVSDDSTALVEMVRWADLFGQSLIEWRAEGNLTHFIVQKSRA
jgi:glycine cleavage system H protein